MSFAKNETSRPFFVRTGGNIGIYCTLEIFSHVSFKAFWNMCEHPWRQWKIQRHACRQSFFRDLGGLLGLGRNSLARLQFGRRGAQAAAVAHLGHGLGKKETIWYQSKLTNRQQQQWYKAKVSQLGSGRRILFLGDVFPQNQLSYLQTLGELCSRGLLLGQ